MKKTLLFFLLTLNLIAGERIVTLSPSINEIVFALGSGKDVVANTQYCNFPKESQNIAKVGGYSNVSLEKLLLSKPSLILSQEYDKSLISNIKKLNLNIKTFKTNNLESIKNTILTVGKLLDKEKKAKVLVDEINENLENLKNIETEKKILIVISPRKDLNKTIYVAGNYLYFDDIIEFSGNKNAYQSKLKSQPMINVEKVIKMNPDIIVLLAPYINDRDITKIQMKQPWLNLPISAAKNKRVYIIDKEYAGIPSNRVVHFIDDFRDILIDARDK